MNGLPKQMRGSRWKWSRGNTLLTKRAAREIRRHLKRLREPGNVEEVMRAIWLTLYKEGRGKHTKA